MHAKIRHRSREWVWVLCLRHLPQDRLLGDDGHPRRAKAGEDPARNGLVLEWVYGSIVSTAEKARDGAKRCLGMMPPTAAEAHLVLVRWVWVRFKWERVRMRVEG